MPPDLSSLPDRLAALPERRRARVLAVLAKETAAERARDLYPGLRDTYGKEVGLDRAALTLRGEGYDFVNARFVRSVIYEGR